MSFHFFILRDKYNSKNTLGTTYFNGEKFSESLEDPVRAEGVKVSGDTALPEGTYFCKVTYSPKFKREMPILYTEKNGVEIIRKNVRFVGVRLHGGNTHVDTLGCPLIAKTRVDDYTIYGSMEKELTKKMKEAGGSGFVTISNGI